MNFKNSQFRLYLGLGEYYYFYSWRRFTFRNKLNSIL